MVDNKNNNITSSELLQSLNGSQFKPETKKDREVIEVLTFLFNKELINKEQLQVSVAEYSINEKPIGSILISNGFLSQKVYIEAILEYNPDSIMNEEAISDTIDFELLLKTKTMIQAETKSHIYVSTLEKESLVRNILQPFIGNKDLVFKVAKLDTIDNYLNKIVNIHYGDASFVDNLIRKALRLGASDIHILPPRDGTYSIFFRIDGVKQHYYEGDMEQYYQVVARIKDRSKIDIAEKRRTQDGAFQVEHKGKYIDLRVATIPSDSEQQIVIRLLDPDRIKPSLQTLGITDVEEWRKGVSRPDGIALICGPTGSGKTTTLQASIREMDRFGKAIYSIEDPVEYRIPFVGQVNVDKQADLDFKEGVKSFMRADPDIIIVGEIRDEETARNAVKAAETGHLVIGTLHTSSIRGIVDRLRDIGVSSNDLKYLLRTVLVQRLIRTKCEECHGAGCFECNDTGYKGRTVISECSYFNDEEEVDALIRGEINWSTIVQDAVKKAREGITDTEEVIRVFGEEGRRALIDNNMEVPA